MAGFSIDITNDGCRAVDPSKKLRYEVTRTSDATPLTPGGETPPPSKRRNSGNPPRPEPSKSAEVPRPTQAKRPSAPPPALAPVAAPVVPAPAAAPAPAVPALIPALVPALVPALAVPVTVAVPAPPVVHATPQIVVPPIVVKREQEATAEVPLTYREYGFALAPGTTEDAAVISLREMLVHIRDAIAAAPAGKLVNLAAFDQFFQGRPPVLPVATLTWKDWKPEPHIAFPRRARAVSKADGGVEAVTVVQQAAPVMASAVVAPVVVPDAFPPVSQMRPATQSAQKPPVPKRRVRGDELISVLFESMHDLHFLRDSIEGGDFCVQLALEKLPSRFAMVYLYDIDRREFAVVCAGGAVPPGIIGRRFAETEPLLSAAMRKRRAVVLGADDPALADHASAFDGARDVLLAPVMQAGRFLGAIEIADPTDGIPFTELDANAITYMAEQYAEFVAARGVLLDRDSSSAQPPAVRSH